VRDWEFGFPLYSSFISDCCLCFLEEIEMTLEFGISVVKGLILVLQIFLFWSERSMFCYDEVVG